MLKVRFFRLAYVLIFYQLLSLLLASCSSNNSLEGDRIALVPESEHLGLNNPGKNISIPQPELIQKWSQFLTGPRRLPANIKLLSAEPFKPFRILNTSSRSSILSPILISDTLYFLDEYGFVHALTTNGSPVWSEKIFHTKDFSIDVFNGGLSYHKGALYLTTPSGSLVSIDAKSGKILWRYTFGQPFRSFPLVYRDKIFVVTGDDLGVSFSLDGKLLWTFSGETQETSVTQSASPSAYRGRVYFPFSSGGIYVVDFQNGRNFWKQFFTSAAIGEGTSLISDFGGNPILTKLGIVTSSFSGQTIFIDFNGRVVWKQSIGTTVSPLVVGSDLFLIARSGFLVRLDLDSGEVVWSRRLDDYNGKKYFEPILVNGSILISRNDRKLSLYSPINGSLIMEKSLRGVVSSSPISYNGELYIPLSNGKLQVF